MLFTFLKQQNGVTKKRRLIRTMILSLNIKEGEKSLYIDSLDILDEQGLNSLYSELTVFVEKIEINEINEIEDKNYSTISGLRKKEAEEKKKEINSFSFLINNL